MLGQQRVFSSNQSSKFVHHFKKNFQRRFIINKISPLAWLCFDLQNQNGVLIEKEEWVLKHLVLSRLINSYKSFYN